MQELCLMCFNIRFDTDRDGDDKWDNRKGDVVGMIKEYNPIILGTQEVLINQRDYIRNELNYQCVGVGRVDGNDDGEFNPIYYQKGEIHCIESGTFWLSRSPYSPGSKIESSSLPRICTWAKFEEFNCQSIFYVFNTHLDHTSSSARMEQSTILLEQISKIAGLYPSILMGDFNSEPSSLVYKTFKNSYYEDTKDIASTSDVIHGDLLSFTGFHSPLSSNSIPKGMCHIDYIFVSGFICKKWEQIIKLRNNGRAFSDHRPLLVKVSNKYAK